jgi:hypothetical protein
MLAVNRDRLRQKPGGNQGRRGRRQRGELDHGDAEANMLGKAVPSSRAEIGMSQAAART